MLCRSICFGAPKMYIRMHVHMYICMYVHMYIRMLARNGTYVHLIVDMALLRTWDYNCQW